MNKLTKIQNALRSFPVALMASVAMPSARAAGGFLTTIQNMTYLAKAMTLLLIAAGVLSGLGLIAYGLLQMHKKGNQQRDDISWMSIFLSIIAGAGLLALTYIGTAGVETLGGSSGDIGRPIQ